MKTMSIIFFEIVTLIILAVLLPARPPSLDSLYWVYYFP